MEILAPGGDVDSIKAAILAGADAVYCGLDKFNARNRASNISFDDLQGILRLGHQNSCQVFLTLNIIFVDSEIPALFALLNKLVNTGIDGVIVQDLGLFYLLSRYFKRLKVHASTQLTTHNEGQIRFLSTLNATRVNLSRELNISEIKALTAVAHQNRILTEVFVHGSYCLSFSGICYMSSALSGNSGNRGRCSQPCRDRYVITPAGKNYPLNLKDNSAFFDVRELYDAEVDSLKIEGRIKKFDYVHTVVNTWKNQLRSLTDRNELPNDNSNLYKVFNRDFSNGFLKGNISKDMFIDHPRDHSVNRLSEVNNYSEESEKEEDQLELYEEKDEIKVSVATQINQINIAKIPVILNVSGKSGSALQVSVKTPETSFDVFSEVELADTGAEPLDYAMIMKRLKAINETGYYIEKLELENLQGKVYLPFKELTAIKKRLLFILNDSRETLDPQVLPALKKNDKEPIKPALSVLISSSRDLYLTKVNSAEVYFQLPEGFKNQSTELTRLFSENENLIPWFPPVLIGDDYRAAVEFLQQVQPQLIVTNNTGIAYEAYHHGISWIAGPHLNIVNSYSLICLKETFNCSGAFISNEISKSQISQIVRPDDFKLHYSIYHPIVLMTSRTCLMGQVDGCEKNSMDETCIPHCERSSTITNIKGETFFIEKTKSNYQAVYHANNFLNTDVVNDFQHLFSCFLIDLSVVKTATQTNADKSEIIQLFDNLLGGNAGSVDELRRIIKRTTDDQYKRGI